METKEIKDVEEILEELNNDINFFFDRLVRLKNGEKIAINTYYRCHNEIAYMCPKCGDWAGDISEYTEYMDNKVPLEKDALCNKCKGDAG